MCGLHCSAPRSFAGECFVSFNAHIGPGVNHIPDVLTIFNCHGISHPSTCTTGLYCASAVSRVTSPWVSTAAVQLLNHWHHLCQWLALLVGTSIRHRCIGGWEATRQKQKYLCSTHTARSLPEVAPPFHSTLPSVPQLRGYTAEHVWAPAALFQNLCETCRTMGTCRRFGAYIATLLCLNRR